MASMGPEMSCHHDESKKAGKRRFGVDRNCEKED